MCAVHGMHTEAFRFHSRPEYSMIESRAADAVQEDVKYFHLAISQSVLVTWVTACVTGGTSKSFAVRRVDGLRATYGQQY